MMTMCPINKDRKLRVRPKYAPYCSSAAPSTMCGNTSGDISTDASAALPGNSYRARASAAGTVSSTAAMVAASASTVLVVNAAI
ncbi:hypothetical protein D3C87_1379840 [compost metagenome]